MPDAASESHISDVHDSVASAAGEVITEPARRVKAAKRLAEIAAQHVVTARSSEGRLMAASAATPHLMEPIGGHLTPPLVPTFRQFEAKYGESPPKEAVASVIRSLEWDAQSKQQAEVHLRSAWCAGVLWIDLGWEDGSVIRVDENGWSIGGDCPVLFTRSGVTGPMADPRVSPPDLRLLDTYVHCRESDLPLVWTILMSSWFSGTPQPVFSMLGSADAGKTTATRLLMDLVDPSTVQPGGQIPKDPRDFKMLAAQRRVMVFDNVSNVSAEQSDMLARVSTGGELASRALYTDDRAHVTQLMRPVWLNGIMSGFSRSDLASRVVCVELLPVAATGRVSVEDLQASWGRDRSAILAGLLGLLVKVLAAVPNVTSSGTYRHAEFERRLAAVDSIMMTDGIQRLGQQARDLSEAVVDATPLGVAVRVVVEAHRAGRQLTLAGPAEPSIFGVHTGEALMQILQTSGVEDSRHMLPTNAKSLGEALERIAPDLERCLGISISKVRVAGRRVTVISDNRRP